MPVVNVPRFTPPRPLDRLARGGVGQAQPSQPRPPLVRLPQQATTYGTGDNTREVRIVTGLCSPPDHLEPRLGGLSSPIPRRGICMFPVRRVATATATIGNRAAIGAVVIALAACGGQHTAASATDSPPPSSPAPQSTSSASTATGAVVHFPNQLLGRNENTSAGAKQVIGLLNAKFVSRLTAALGGGEAAMYGGGQSATTATSNFFFVIAAPLAKPISPDTFARKLQSSMLARGVTDAKVFPAGANGRALVCGQAQSDIICSWADHVSLGIVLYSPGFASSLNDGASRTEQIRSAVVR
jgi:hypothetical protein